MTDLTVLYYTANRISDTFRRGVWAQLEETLDDLAPPRVPILVISQQRVDEPGARNLVVGSIGASIYNVYRQILAGARAATTPYVACVEDDCLYVPEHFTCYRPAADTFGYNHHRWVLSADGTYYWRERTQMAQCIAPRELLIETLEERFGKYPAEVPHAIAKRSGWGEPGRYEKNLKLTPRRLEYFRTQDPNVTFNHAASLMGRRRVNPTDLLVKELEPWGSGQALWDRVHG